MKSIIQKHKECFACGSQKNLELHHIFGASNRKKSDKYGLTVYLCHNHHNEPPEGVHFNKEFREKLQSYAQALFNINYEDENFVEIFGKNYCKE